MLSEGKIKAKKRGGQFGPFRGGQLAPFRMRKSPFSGVVNLLRFEVVSLTVFSNKKVKEIYTVGSKNRGCFELEDSLLFYSYMFYINFSLVLFLINFI